MGLFSQDQMDQINAVAAKSKEVLKPIQVSKSVTSTQHEIDESTRSVLEYFGDSPAILITSVQELHDYITKVIESGYCAIDTETTGLDRIHDTIVGCSLYYPGGVECYIPNKHIVPIFETPYKNQLTYEEVGRELKRLVITDVKTIWYNADFDIAMIYKDYQVDFIPVFYYDCMIAWRCLKENESVHGLKALYAKYVQGGKGDPKKFTDFFSPKLFPYSRPEVAKLYAANDAKITYELFMWQLPYVTKTHPKCQKYHLEMVADLVWNIEFPMVHVCALMHRTGVYLDMDTSNVLKPRYHAKRDKEFKILASMIQEFMSNADVITISKSPFKTANEFNPNSPPQVSYLLKRIVGLDIESTEKEALAKLNLPITNQLLKVRSLDTLIGGFVDKLPGATGPTGRIHSSFNSIGASTGRMSSSDPNVQNIPSHALDVRHQFRATPAMEKIGDCERVDDKLQITLGSYDSVTLNGGEHKDVLDICVGDEVISVKGVLKIREVNHHLPYTTLTFDASQLEDSIKYITPAYVMMSSDYSQQEPKMLAFLCASADLIDSFKRGRDIYATIASLAFNYPYEECLEFNPVTGANQPDGKDRRSKAKKIVLGITYGMSTKSIGEDLFGKNKNMTEQERTAEADKIYAAVLGAFPDIKAFMEASENNARRYGYVETILGRRRHIPDMQLKPYEFKAGRGYINPDIDPLDPKTLHKKNELPARVVAQLETEFSKYKYKGQIYKRIKQLEEDQHIIVINNSTKIAKGRRKTTNCVDLETEILTTTGWKKYNEVSVGDEILSYAMTSNTIEKDHINEIFYYPEEVDTVQFKSQSFEAVSTLDHRWVTGEYDKTPKFRTTQDLCKLKWPYPILRTAGNQFEDNPNISDLELKLLGWIMTDGTMKIPTNGVSLFQSTAKPKNACVFEDMLNTLTALNFAHVVRDRKDCDAYHEIYINKNKFTSWVYDTFPNRVLSWDFVNTLSQHQSEVLIRAMLQGDGEGVDGYGQDLPSNTTKLICRNRESCDIFQYLCFRAGYSTNVAVIDPNAYDYPSQHVQYASMNNIPKASKIYYMVSLLRFDRAYLYPRHISRIRSNGVWCVSTSQGTWVARRRGKVFITGNSRVQGSAAELTKIAILKVFNSEEWKALGGRVLLPVHDELIAEIPIRNAARGGEILSRLMSEAGSFLPFTISCDVTTTLRWYGLAYPCVYDKPDELKAPSELTASEISWIQYHLFELEYALPIHKKEGVKLEGDAALGVDGEWSDAMDTFILDYINRYHISKDQFLDHIEEKVIYDLQKFT